MTATTFVFDMVKLGSNQAELLFSYRVEFSDSEPLLFTESIALEDENWKEHLPEKFVENILRDLHLVLGISYYKTFLPSELKHPYQLAPTQADFWNQLYRGGLGEFMYRNQLPFERIAQFTATESAPVTAAELRTSADEVLVGIGGGKDSIVALELLKKKFAVTGFVKEAGMSKVLATEIADLADVPLVTMRRKLDQQLLDGISGSYDGHVPVSAMYAFLGVLQAAIEGQGFFAAANEYSSTFGNLEYDGEIINHKWSGGIVFETLFQDYLNKYVTPSVRYFSPIRPFYSLRVVKEFTEVGEKYFHTFTSCNRNFAHKKTGFSESRWCGSCPKCAFGFLTLSAFLEKKEVVEIFKKDLFEDESLLPLFSELLGLGETKPFDCVGTYEESQYALWLAAGDRSDSFVVRTLLPNIADKKPSEEIMRAQMAETVPTRFRMLGMHSALILGYGKEGQITKEFLEEYYPNVRIGIADQSTNERYLDDQHDYDIVVKTPGIPQSKIARQYTTATQFFLNKVPREQVVGVTGSKGKSTTSSLLAAMLQEAGKDVRLIGNIGTPALSSVLAADYSDETIFVFEMSSYQLENVDISPGIAVVTSIFPEHLDHHGSYEKYLAAKKQIVAHQSNKDHFFFNPRYKELKQWSKDTRANVHEIVETISCKNDALRPLHMQENAALAAAAAKQLGASEENIISAMEAFRSLPHRLEFVCEKNGIIFYDDSISTTPDSTIAALNSIPKVETIFLGGVDRGYDFSLLEKEMHTKGVRNVLLFPDSGEYMLSDESGFNVLHTNNMNKAVEFAVKHTSSGSVCLLSPAAASYNLYKDFKERGEKFKTAVREIKASSD